MDKGVWVGNAMPRFCANSALWVALVLFVPLWAFNAPLAHANDANGKAAPQGATVGESQFLLQSEHKGVIPPPPIGNEGIYTDAPNPKAGHEKEVIPPPEPSDELRHGRDPQRLL